MKFTGFLFIAVILASCSGTKNLEEPDSDKLLISMKKESCFGDCPAYTFNLYDGGYCEFIGVSNTYKQGKHALTLSKEKFKEVKTAFKEADVFQYEDYYESNIPDLPTVVLSYHEGDRSKTITGKRERPDAVHKLQFRLEQIAESRTGWEIIDGSIKEEKPEYDETQIELELVNGAQLSRWFDNARQNYGIRILKRLDASYDKWLISYNIKDYTPKEILGILNKDENVASASFRRLDP